MNIEARRCIICGTVECKSTKCTAQAAKPVIESLKKYALERYEQGGDIMVECWDEADWVEFIIKCEEEDLDRIKELRFLMGLWKERREEIEGTRF